MQTNCLIATQLYAAEPSQLCLVRYGLVPSCLVSLGLARLSDIISVYYSVGQGLTRQLRLIATLEHLNHGSSTNGIRVPLVKGHKMMHGMEA
jgi:hypothetical protein